MEIIALFLKCQKLCTLTEMFENLRFKIAKIGMESEEIHFDMGSIQGCVNTLMCDLPQ